MKVRVALIVAPAVSTLFLTSVFLGRYEADLKVASEAGCSSPNFECT